MVLQGAVAAEVKAIRRFERAKRIWSDTAQN
jgi:hypothetical protein